MCTRCSEQPWGPTRWRSGFHHRCGRNCCHSCTAKTPENETERFPKVWTGERVIHGRSSPARASCWRGQPRHQPPWRRWEGRWVDRTRRLTTIRRRWLYYMVRTTLEACKDYHWQRTSSELTAGNEQSKDQKLHRELSSAEGQWDLPPFIQHFIGAHHTPENVQQPGKTNQPWR